jgi:hypothetical protein
LPQFLRRHERTRVKQADDEIHQPFGPLRRHDRGRYRPEPVDVGRVAP